MAQPIDDYLRGLFDLSGKVAVVIGGTGVLCGQMALCLAKAGARVVVAGRSESKGADRVTEIESAGGTARFVGVDVGDRASIQGLCDTVCRDFGRVDILINGAGVNSAVPYFEIADEDWRKILDVNLNSLHQACQIFGSVMTQQQNGCIINVGSVSAGIPLSRVFAYAASKAAVINYSQNLARELAPAGVRVNVISPGFFPAEQNRKILSPERTDKIMARTPLARFGEPQELDGAILLLASDSAGSFVTGCNLIVDGGFTSTSI